MRSRLVEHILGKQTHANTSNKRNKARQYEVPPRAQRLARQQSFAKPTGSRTATLAKR